MSAEKALRRILNHAALSSADLADALGVACDNALDDPPSVIEFYELSCEAAVLAALERRSADPRLHFAVSQR